MKHCIFAIRVTDAISTDLSDVERFYKAYQVLF